MREIEGYFLVVTWNEADPILVARDTVLKQRRLVICQPPLIYNAVLLIEGSYEIRLDCLRPDIMFLIRCPIEDLEGFEVMPPLATILYKHIGQPRRRLPFSSPCDDRKSLGEAQPANQFRLVFLTGTPGLPHRSA
jgi:hypothetical protein